MVFRLTAAATAAMIGLSAPAGAANLGPLEFDFVITDLVHNGDPSPGGGLLDVILSLPEKPAPPPGTNKDNPVWFSDVVFNIRAPEGKAIAVNYDANPGFFRKELPGSFEFDVRSLSKGQFPVSYFHESGGNPDLSATYSPLDGEAEKFTLLGYTRFQRRLWRSEDVDPLYSPSSSVFGENVIISSGAIGFGKDDVLTNIRIESPMKRGQPPGLRLFSAGQPWDLFSASFSVHSLDGSNGPMTLSLVDAPAPIPLPGTGPFALAGLAVLAAVARRRRAAAVSG